VTGDLGNISLHLDSTFYHLKKAFEKATKFDGSSYPKQPTHSHDHLHDHLHDL
jgi:hypothetical protein